MGKNKKLTEYAKLRKREIVFTPIDFAEDMGDSDILSQVVSQGSDMYHYVKQLQDALGECLTLLQEHYDFDDS